MDASPTVELGWLQQPQVVPCVMAEGHRVLEDVLLQGLTSQVLGLFLLFDVLLDQATLVVVEVLEDKLLVQGVFLEKGLVALEWRRLLLFFEFEVVLDCLLFDILKSIEGIHKGKHGFSIVFSVTYINLNEESEWHIVKSILFKLD